MHQQIGKYEIQEEIGKGGFGTVYRAYDPVVGREVAIKVLTALGSEDMLRRFRAEAKATGNLHHPNIVTVHDYGEQDGVPYIVMEFLRGRNLDALITEGSLPLMDKAEIMSQVAEGLNYAHRQGVVHRDVKPANVMLLNSGLVKIMDFGIARIMTENSTRYTQTGFLVGSLPYMSPERFGENPVVDALCDVWAVGVVYYELLSGRRPFIAEDIGNLVFQINRAEPPPLAVVATDCPPELHRIVMRALSKNRELRYNSLDDFRVDNQLVLLDLKRSSAARMVEEARRLYTNGDLRGAQMLARRVLELDPRNEQARQLRDHIQTQTEIQVLLKQADDYLAQGYYAEAAATLETARKLSPEEGAIATRLQQTRMLAERKESVRKLLTAAQEQFRMGQVPAALQYLDEALKLEPGHEEATRLKRLYSHEAERMEALRQGLLDARQFLDRQMFPQAWSIIQRLEVECPFHPEVAELRVQTESAHRQWDKQRRLEQTLAQAGEFIREGHFSQAVACLEPLVAEFSGERELERLYSFAVSQKEAKAKSDAVSLLISKARSLSQSRQYSAAILALENGLKDFPDESELLGALSSANAAHAEHEKQRAVEAEADCARKAIAKKRFEEARDIVDQALTRFGAEPVLISLGQTIEQELYLAHKHAEVQKAQKAVAEMVRASKAKEALELVSALLVSYPDDPILTALLRDCQEAAQKQEIATLRPDERIATQIPSPVHLESAPRRTAGSWIGVGVVAIVLLGGIGVLWQLIFAPEESAKPSAPMVEVLEQQAQGAPTPVPPSIALSAESLQFEWRAGGAAPEPQSISVLSRGEPAQFTVSGADTLVQAAPGSGSTPANVAIKISPSDLPPGEQRRVLTISSGSSSRQLSVLLRVLPAPPPARAATPQPKQEVKPQPPLVVKKEPEPAPKQQMEETPPPVQPVRAVPPKPDPAPSSPASRLPAPRQALSLDGYLGRLRGELTWMGSLPANSALTFQGGEASSGLISGDDLPRVPVSVEAGSGFLIVEAPSASNNWDRLVVRNTTGNPLPRLRIQWRVLR
jgi:tetratricopeptide (TPR) repeat protein/predicted Ser/Thr protein kinase